MKEEGKILIRRVRDPYGWLGNMSPYPVTYDGVHWYNTTEALFQALRFADAGIRELIRLEKSPMSAKMKAKKLAEHRIKNWTAKEDIEAMTLCLRLKLHQHPELQAELLATGDRDIVEDCTKRPHGSGLFWGAALRGDGYWEGQNWLGVIWKTLRNELKFGHFKPPMER